VLQVGPGDLCRVAFRTVRGQKSYTVFYDGPAPTEKPPAWTATAGLVLETRRLKPCDLGNPASVRAAFATAEPLGSDYVPAVGHRFNPIAPSPEPFLSVYRGTLQIATAGKYRFFTSSQDCRFLLVDGEQVVAAPGAHGPVGDAEYRGEFRPIPTRTTGLRVCEHLPRLAAHSDKLALLRAMTHPDVDYTTATHYLLTGRSVPRRGAPRTKDRPAYGSVLSWLGRGCGPLPPCVSMMPVVPDGAPRFVEESHGQDVGWLGPAHHPLRINADAS
jgi:hypothetical protein